MLRQQAEYQSFFDADYEVAIDSLLAGVTQRQARIVRLFHAQLALLGDLDQPDHLRCAAFDNARQHVSRDKDLLPLLADFAVRLRADRCDRLGYAAALFMQNLPQPARPRLRLIRGGRFGCAASQ